MRPLLKLGILAFCYWQGWTSELTTLLLGIYFFHFYTDGSEHTGHRAHCPRVCTFPVLRWLRRFFGHWIVRVASRSDAVAPSHPRRPRLYVCHPHGLLTFHTIATFMVLNPTGLEKHYRDERQDGELDRLKQKEWRVVAHKHWFSVPVLRDLALASGMVHPRWNTLDALMRERGFDLVVVAEGVHGMEKTSVNTVKQTNTIQDKRGSKEGGVASRKEGTAPLTLPPDCAPYERILWRCWSSGYEEVEVVLAYCPNELELCRPLYQREWPWVTTFRTWWFRTFTFPLVFFKGPWPWRPLIVLLSDPFLVRQQVRVTDTGREARPTDRATSFDEYCQPFRATLSRLEAYWELNKARLEAQGGSGEDEEQT
jgi:hypothetical protein